MSKLITLAVFDNVFDINFNLLKDMLDEAGIDYVTGNEYSRTVKPVFYRSPSNTAIDIKVYEDKLEEAMAILKSIQ